MRCRSRAFSSASSAAASLSSSSRDIMAVLSRISEPIPPEILDTCLQSHLDDHETLLVAALVCRDWAPVAQRVLLKSIKFNQSNMIAYDRAVTLLAELLEEKPELIPFIREVEFLWSHRWLTIFFERIELSSVTSFTLKEMSYLQIPAEDLQAERRLVKLPSMTTVDLTGCTFEDVRQLTALLGECGLNVKKLKLHRVCLLRHRYPAFKRDNRFNLITDSHGYPIEDEERFPPPIKLDPFAGECAKLEKLELVRGASVLLAAWLIWDSSPFDLTGLKTLRYEEDGHERYNARDDEQRFRIQSDRAAVTTILEKCASTLEHLEMYAARSVSEGDEIDISPKALPNLKTLTIAGLCPDSIKTAIRWVTSLTSENRIHHLTLKVSFGSLAVRKDATQSWADLDNALDDLNLPFLRGIDVKIPRKHNQSDEDVEKRLKKYFPRISGRESCKLVVL
ncbi:unnamed protein product [Cyclocybe aegerita]|uniref:F-box domain-containing protein n=1 Tax=Cyclocybe aegerita TaxID=1973307 RepID=A0A8S0XRW5_CYCAE|nr:unnamed protein product [Cyclocybe aegerita]